MVNIMLDGLKKYLDTPNGKKEIADWFENIDKDRNNNIRKIEKAISHLSDDDLHKLFMRFVEWETKLEDHYYKNHHCLTNSKIFSAVIDFVQDRGKIIKDDGDFVGGSWEYKGYRFVVYHGQGSFWRIFYNDGCIFKST